mmetsp:Transcript_33378/g.37970  ORF Transcript_33378/g.37970 Transcript_33378/m.37970 type:complete len:154 (+) Transcript_33378:26-487(+)
MTASSSKPSHRIVIPERVIQGGLEIKFEYHHKHIALHGLLSPEEYRATVTKINLHLKKSRSNVLDGMLLVTGPLMVPLAVWGIRHRNQKRRKKSLLKEAIREFNDTHDLLWMKYIKRSNGSILTIEERKPEHHCKQNMNMKTIEQEHYNHGLV